MIWDKISLGVYHWNCYFLYCVFFRLCVVLPMHTYIQPTYQVDNNIQVKVHKFNTV